MLPLHHARNWTALYPSTRVSQAQPLDIFSPANSKRADHDCSERQQEQPRITRISYVACPRSSCRAALHNRTLERIHHHFRARRSSVLGPERMRFDGVGARVQSTERNPRLPVLRCLIEVESSLAGPVNQNTHYAVSRPLCRQPCDARSGEAQLGERSVRRVADAIRASARVCIRNSTPAFVLNCRRFVLDSEVSWSGRRPRADLNQSWTVRRPACSRRSIGGVPVGPTGVFVLVGAPVDGFILAGVITGVGREFRHLCARQN